MWCIFFSVGGFTGCIRVYVTPIYSLGNIYVFSCAYHSYLLSVTWRKSNVEIRSDAFHVVKAEGERHSLLIKRMRPNNAGTYCVTAVNTAGRASCSATLYIQSGEARPEKQISHTLSDRYKARRDLLSEKR